MRTDKLLSLILFQQGLTILKPLHAHLSDSNRGIYISVEDDEAMNAGIELSRLEGIIPAIETAHAFSVFDKIDMKNKVVVINLSGRGDKDLETYIKWGKY